MKKKKIIICLSILFLLMLIIISFALNKNDEDDILVDDPEEILENAERQSDKISKKEMKNHTEINVEKFLDYINNKEKKIILFARPSCYYCQKADPILKNIAYKYDVEINYINTEKVKEEEISKLNEVDELFQDLGAPTLIIIENGKIEDMVDGLTDKAHYLEFFKNNKVIK